MRSENTPVASIGTAEAVASALHAYLSEIDGYRIICQNNEKTAAIHDVGNVLQIYRMFRVSTEAIDQLRNNADRLPNWNTSVFWQTHESDWRKLENQITARMKRHTKLQPIITCGIEWNGLPILVHAYKFEPDPFLKIELITPTIKDSIPMLPLQLMAQVLECHAYLLPEYVTTPLAPYTGHDGNFLTISEYLSRVMPKQLYATRCLQRVSCHASNGVGSRDTLCEHTGTLASHSSLAKAPATT